MESPRQWIELARDEQEKFIWNARCIADIHNAKLTAEVPHCLTRISHCKDDTYVFEWQLESKFVGLMMPNWQDEYAKLFGTMRPEGQRE